MIHTVIRRTRHLSRKMRRRVLYAVSPVAKRKYEMEKLVGPIGYWDQLSTYQISFLKQVGLEPHHSLLDIGCGPLQGGIPSIAYLDRQKYVGVDIRVRPLEVAHERIAEHELAAKNAILLQSDSFGAQELGDTKFDFIWMSQLMYHLSDNQLSELFAQLKRYTHADSAFYGDILVDHPAHAWLKSDSRWEGFVYHMRTPERIAELSEPFSLSVTDLGSLEDFGYPPQVSLRTNRMLRITPMP